MPSRSTDLLRFCFFLAALVLSESKCAADDLRAKIEEIIDGPAYKHAHWGILIVDSRTGEPFYERNSDRLFLPASTTKLYSCAAALAAFGPDYRFETPVYCRGEIRDGRLQGDLILVAQGDLTMGGRTTMNGEMAFRNHDHIYAGGTTEAELTDTDPLAGLKELARQVKAAGIDYVAGDVLIDDRLFDKAQGSGSGPRLISPIIVNDNIVDLVVTPAAEAGKPANVTMRPQTSTIHVDAWVETVSEGQKTEIRVKLASPHTIVVRGKIPVNSKPRVRIQDVPDPAIFARGLFIEALKEAGVKVVASPLEQTTAELPDKASYAKLPRVATFTSPPFSEVIKVTLKVSHNLYASTLPLLLAVKQGKRTLGDGFQIQRRFLTDLGIDRNSVTFASGAGGANADAVTPQASVQLLRELSKRSDFKVFHAGLPVLGIDGTLADAVSDTSPAKGKAQGKTGTLSWYDLLGERTLLTSKALAGVMTTAKGRSLTFAIYVNFVPLPKDVQTTREGKTIGQLCEVIYEHAP
jgi:D-alanyl-D-alanine carboxypeptidase/D-alanyl-D-alanine-endopeptidase (penicillin-binding protein 4)